MKGSGSCCIARYATGGAYYDMREWDKIMLRFRPIAPKPVAAKSPTASGGSSSESNDAVRTKRKYARSVKDNNNNNNNNKRKTRRRDKTSSLEKQNHAPVVTLPLLPETPDLKDLTIPETKEVHKNTNKNMLNFNNLSHAKIEPELKPSWYYGTTVCYSCVTVESVSDTWQQGESLGSTDEDRRVNLSKDTCPGFISDGYGRVTWTNSAYRERVGEGACVVLLTMKNNVSVVVTNPLSFTCKVSVVCYDTCGKERRSFMVPCDVWSMEFGGFAWRLDLKAALTLSFCC
ncbi:hypothetical protein Lal_00024001 [Lupinus albus]|uniref:DUF7950 domain-containing protein n=1 Tax=Lupinus albus TaxID=3870 RepID=A0A6A4PIT2_LUPAL|nr:hypothetical protein Lalb_Chr13g0297411 [Lupinus albus]KAF1887992.1 hypothetical protein Lal_00024001 [Lupinus albus]